MKHLGDITKINGAEIETVDIITGGSPCQDLSVAGLRAGLAGERSGLFMEQIRIVKELREHDRQSNKGTNRNPRPRFMVWENVEGALSSPGGDRKGEDFRAVLEEIVKIVRPDAPHIPLPNGGRWPKSGAFMGRGPDGVPFSVAYRLHDAQFWGVPQRRKRLALVVDFGGLAAPEILFERQGLRGDFEQGEEARENSPRTTTEGARSASDIRGDTPPITVLNDQGGGVMSISENKTATLRAQEHGHAPVVYAADLYNQTQLEEKTQTLRAIKSDSDHIPCVYGASSLGNYAPQVSPLRAAGGDNGGGSENLVCSSAVRRLTPMECERLQGFPDGWTDIGAWTDTRGRLHKESSDAARYKALGNSIALPFWFWLLRRISAQYERPATLGSLFDGIGGFPLCWERCNGQGTARWASEIEEFPIAVTKRRFPQ